MMTLVSLICILTMFFWLRIWDKAIKKKVKIIELLPRGVQIQALLIPSYLATPPEMIPIAFEPLLN